MRAGRSMRRNFAKPEIATSSPVDTVAVISSVNDVKKASASRRVHSLSSASSFSSWLRFTFPPCDVGKCGVHRYTFAAGMWGSQAQFQGFFATRPSACQGWRVPPPVEVSDPADPRLADYVDLADPEFRRRVEADGDFFVAESPWSCGASWSRAGGSDPCSSPRRSTTAPPALSSPGSPPRCTSRPTRCCGGWSASISTAARSRRPIAGRSRGRPVLDGARRVAVLEKVNDYENLGVLFRTRPRSASTRCCSTRSAPIRCIAAASGSRSGTRSTAVDAGGLARRRAGRGFHHRSRSRPRPTRSDRRVEWPERSRAAARRRGPGSLRRVARGRRPPCAHPDAAGADSLNVATAAAIAFYAAAPAGGSRPVARRRKASALWINGIDDSTA